MRHPLEFINPGIQKKSFIILLSLTILMMAMMNMIGAPLTTPAAPAGIVSFELAFTPGRTQSILSSWSQGAIVRAGFIQGLDFLFPLVYSAALGLGCLLAARILGSKNKPLSELGTYLAWGMLFAALCDYIENIALAAMLFGKPQSPFPAVAGICAVIKFLIILIAILYLLYGLIARLSVQPLGKSAT